MNNPSKRCEISLLSTTRIDLLRMGNLCIVLVKASKYEAFAPVYDIVKTAGNAL